MNPVRPVELPKTRLVLVKMIHLIWSHFKTIIIRSLLEVFKKLLPKIDTDKKMVLRHLRGSYLNVCVCATTPLGEPSVNVVFRSREN